MSTAAEALALADRLSTAALLQDGVTVLQRRGWTRHAFQDHEAPVRNRPVDVVGAIAVAHGGAPEDYRDHAVLRALLALARRTDLVADDASMEHVVDDRAAAELMHLVGDWNDVQTRASVVIRVLEGTAAWLRYGRDPIPAL